MSDERWADIFAKKHSLVLPGAPSRRREIPPEGPTCATHCSGRHDHDGWLCCRRCGGRAARVVMHEFAHQPGHYFTAVEPLDGAAVTACCGEPLRRMFR